MKNIKSYYLVLLLNMAVFVKNINKNKIKMVNIKIFYLNDRFKILVKGFISDNFNV